MIGVLRLKHCRCKDTGQASRRESTIRIYVTMAPLLSPRFTIHISRVHNICCSCDFPRVPGQMENTQEFPPKWWCSPLWSGVVVFSDVVSSDLRYQICAGDLRTALLLSISRSSIRRLSLRLDSIGQFEVTTFGILDLWSYSTQPNYWHTVVVHRSAYIGPDSTPPRTASSCIAGTPDILRVVVGTTDVFRRNFTPDFLECAAVPL